MRLEMERATAEPQAHPSADSSSCLIDMRQEKNERNRKDPGNSSAISWTTIMDPRGFDTTRAFVAIASLTAFACGGSSSPTGPTQPQSQPQPQPSTISGVVVVRTPQGDRPANPYPLEAWIEAERAFRRVSFDADGRYEVSGLTSGSWVWFLVLGYWSPCAHAVTTVPGRLTRDIVVFDTFSVPTDPDAPGFRSITGNVYAQTESGRRPLTGAQVEYAVTSSAGTQSGSAIVAWTRTDNGGRFRLCGLPLVSAGDVIASDANERQVRRSVPPGPSTSIDLEFR